MHAADWVLGNAIAVQYVDNQSQTVILSCNGRHSLGCCFYLQRGHKELYRPRGRAILLGFCKIVGKAFNWQ